MAIDSKQVVQLVGSAGRLVGVQEILRAGGLDNGEQNSLKQVLRELVKSGKLSREGKRYGVAGEKHDQKSGPAWGGKKPAVVRAELNIAELAAKVKTPKQPKVAGSEKQKGQPKQPKQEKDGRQNQQPKSEKGAQQPKQEKGGRQNQQPKSEKGAQQPRQEKGGRQNQQPKSEKGAQQPRQDKGGRQNQQPESEKGAQQPRQEKGGRQNQQHKTEKSVQQPRQDKGGRQNQQPKSEKGAQQDKGGRQNQQPKSEKGAQQDKGGRQNQQPKSEKGAEQNQQPRQDKSGRQPREPKQQKGAKQTQRPEQLELDPQQNQRPAQKSPTAQRSESDVQQTPEQIAQQKNRDAQNERNAQQKERSARQAQLPEQQNGKNAQQNRGDRNQKPAQAASQTPTKGPRGGKLVTGIIHHHRDGFAFVKAIVGQDSEDLFIPPDEARKALDNDQVEVEIVPGRDGRTAGRIVSVKSRTRQMVIGTYQEDARRAWVEPREATLGMIRVPKTQIARPGDVVKVRLGVGGAVVDDPSHLTGEVAGSLGATADHSVEVLSVAFAKGFQDEFPPEVMDEADLIPLEVAEKEAKGEQRRDLRSMPLITIDGEDARDFDDAVFCETHPRGWRLVVAIADVSHYVVEGTALDTEALRRATSVYLPSRVLPMLPERLSNGICSLRPEVDRLCMVADMVIDKQGHTVESEVYPGVMRSAARCTYTEVHDVLNGTNVPGRTELKGHFEKLFTLSKTLTAMRLERGAIDFDLPEQRVELGEDGLPLRLIRRERWESHRLVEECMLAANETVARFFREQGLPSVNRYHAEPDEDRLDMFITLLGAYGVTVPQGEFTSTVFNEVLKNLEGHPEQRALNQLGLRSMMQAVYSSRHAGHYGLGATDYLHFTSPIRRYPDLLVHRLLKALWKRGKRKLSDEQNEAETERLEALAVQCSERERAAMQVEREVNQLYACLLMKDRIGEEHPGVVAGLTDNGFYVQLDELWVEGFVKGESVFPDFEFDQATYRLTFSNGVVVKVGGKCTVRVANVNMERKQIDFQCIALEGEEVEVLEVEERPARGGGRFDRGGGGGGKRFGGGKKQGGGEKKYRSNDSGGRFGKGGNKVNERGDVGSTRRFGKEAAAAAVEAPGRGAKRFGRDRFAPTATAGKKPEGRFASDRPTAPMHERRVPQGGKRFPDARPNPVDPSKRFGGGGRKDEKRREQPPPQPWEAKSEEADVAVTPKREEPKTVDGGFDPRAVLDRLWRERGGGRKR